jgi:cytoskeletal protein RodZ
MESIGTWLRHEREVRGVSLEEVADATRIPVQSLASIEDGRFDELPGEVFVKGFLRSYARAVGLRGDDVLARYSIEVRARDVKPIAVRVSIPPQDRGRRFGLAIALVVFGILATLAISFLLRPRTQDRPEELSARPAPWATLPG